MKNNMIKIVKGSTLREGEREKRRKFGITIVQKNKERGFIGGKEGYILGETDQIETG